MRSAAPPQHGEEDERADDRHEERTETAEAIRKEGEHLRSIARAALAGLVNFEAELKPG
jgi:hypothetical protein